MSGTESLPSNDQEVDSTAVKETVSASETGTTENKGQEIVEQTKEKVNGQNDSKPEEAKSLYEFTVKDIDGNEVCCLYCTLL